MLSEKGNGVLSYGSHALRSEYRDCRMWKRAKGTQEAEGNTEIQEVEGNDGPIEIVYWNQWTQEDETAF